MGLMSFLSDL